LKRATIAFAPDLLLLLSACTGTATVTPTTPPSPIAAASPPAATLPPANEPTDEVACFTREDLAAMTLTQVSEMSRLCYRSSDGVETHIDQARALAAIADFLQEPERLVGFREITIMANSPDGLLRVARFEDDRGRSYLVAVTANRVLEMDPGPASLAVEGPRLAEAELQARADALIARELPQFLDLKPSLASTGDVKSGDNYFFRYEYTAGGPWGGLPPLAQVGITADGQIFSYLNTLYFVL
jgi:hypothetical protein